MTTLKRSRWLLLLAVVGGIASAPRISEAQTRTHHDILLQFNDPRGFITVTVGGQPANLSVKRAILSLSSPDVNCSGSTCPFTVNYLAVAIQNFTQALLINGDPGSFAVQDPWVVIHGPVAVNKNSTQLIIPAGTPAELNANLSGGTSSHSITPGTRRQTSGTLSDVVIRLDPLRQISSIDGVFDFTISAMGATVAASARFTSSNVGAFDNTPPVANAGPDLTVTCPGVVTLDGSASTDAQNNITSYAWDAGNQGHVTTRSPRAQLRFGAGVHPVTLTVSDFYDSTSTDSMVVTVVDPPPTFTFVPPDVIGATCGPVNIGTARASSPCEPLTVTNNAPARFPYGLTVVTWRGTTPSGKTITATQRVVVIPGDDVTCCPAGSNIIRGTSNNDTLNGTAGRDCILAFGGQDTINGGGGDDVISAGEGDDIVHAGSGNDVVSGGGGQDQLFGEDGNDIMFGGTGDDVLDGAAGNDELHGGDGQDRLTCGVGDDRAFGDAGDDTLLGQDGNDFLDGGLNNNHCNGGNGVDIIMSCIADDGVDQIPGGVGADNFDVCQCAPANKCVDCSSVVQACTATAGCRAILRCVFSLPACHQPNECASTCENGFPQDAIQQAGITASCLGGC